MINDEQIYKINEQIKNFDITSFNENVFNIPSGEYNLENIIQLEQDEFQTIN